MADATENSGRSQLGWFWLPDRPEHRVPGVVESDDNSIWVRLLGTLERKLATSYSLPTDVLYQAVFAELLNPLELYTVHGANLWYPSATYSALRATAGVAGAHNADDQTVKRVRFRMDLDLLVSRPITQKVFTKDVDLLAQVDLLKVDPLIASIPNGFVRISANPVLRAGQPNRPVELDVSHRIDVEFTEPVPWKELGSKAIQPLRQLITLMRAARPPVHDVSFAAETDKVDSERPNLARELDWPSWLRGRDARTGRRVEHLAYGHVRRWDGVGDDLSTFVSRWWSWASREENARVLNSLNRTAPVEHRADRDEFADAVSALEEYAARFEPDRTAHRDRVERLTSFIPDGDPDRDWARSRFDSGGGIGFGKKLKLVRDAHSCGANLLGDDAALDKMGAARHKLSHGDYPAGYDLLEIARKIREYIVVLAVAEPEPPNGDT